MKVDENLVLRGDSTTHAENTEENRPTLCVDWVTASFKTALNLQNIMQFFGVSELEKLEVIQGARYGFAGYTITYRLGLIELMHKEESQEWLINLSGQGCREYELISGYDFLTFFALMTHFHPTYTRLDIAIDDFANIYNVGMIRNACKNEQIVSRLKEFGSHVRGLLARPDKLTMDNFYLGSSKSRYFINIYDKKLERAAKGYEVSYETWTRTEIRFKNEYAAQMVDNIMRSSDTLGDIIFAFLNANVAILKPTIAKTTTNRGRDAQDIKNHVRWWRDYLNTVKKLKLSVYKPDLPLVASKTWLLDKVATTLSLFKMYFNKYEFNAFLQELNRVGFEKMDKKHIKRLEKQIMLDKAIADERIEDEFWRKTVFEPQAKKLAMQSLPLDKRKKLKQNNDRHEKLMDIYWNQVVEQQQFEQKKSTEPFGQQTSC